MRQEHVTQALVITIVLLFLVICFSGCTSNQSTNQNDNNIFTGTWIGNVPMPLFGRNGNASISKIMFSGDTVEMTVSSEQVTFTTNYTYSLDGTTLVLEPQFNGRGGFPGQQPFNGTRPGNWTRPPVNESGLINGTYPYNGTRPTNWTRPMMNGTLNTGIGRPSMTISFTYSVNQDHTVLYLNGAEFRRNFV
jgi:hypothetical protein